MFRILSLTILNQTKKVMRKNKFFLAVIVGAVAIFLLGFLTYGIILRDSLHNQMMAGVERDQPIFWIMIVSHFVWAYFLVLNFSSWSDISTPSAGAMRGAMIAFLVSVSIDAIWYGHSHVMKKWGVIMDVAAWTVSNAIVGAIIGWILGMNKKSTAS